jgi:hypothetical protein
MGLLVLGVVPVASAGECPALLNHSFPGLVDGKPQSLCQYQGKVILVVNTASFSRCPIRLPQGTGHLFFLNCWPMVN